MLGRISKPLLFLLFLSGSLLSSCSDLRSFHAIGAAVQTDKVVHGYHELYEFYLGPRRHLPLRLLEVGLGCNMPYGPGASLQVRQPFKHSAHQCSAFLAGAAPASRAFGLICFSGGVQLWREYIKNASISYVEYDSKCANKWQKRIENLGRGASTCVPLCECSVKTLAYWGCGPWQADTGTRGAACVPRTPPWAAAPFAAATGC